MSAELSFVEHVTVKMGIAGVHAAKAWLEAQGAPPPTAEQISRIARESAPIVENLVKKAKPVHEASDQFFTELTEACCVAVIGVAAIVTGIVKAPARN